MDLKMVLLAAHGALSTVYGFNEKNCGDVGAPVACAYGAVTASGEIFNPKIHMAAIAAPFDLVLSASYIYIRTAKSKCVKVLLADKMNPRFIGKRGFDLSPAAVRLLTGKEATPYWSDKVYICKAFNEDWDSQFQIAFQPNKSL